MADVVVEYLSRVKRTVEIPDEIYTAIMNRDLDEEGFEKASEYLEEKVWPQVVASDAGYIDACGVYTIDEKYALAEY